MAGTLRVHDWHQFQHYKERNPSWIKLHKNLLDNFKYQRLPVDSRALAPMIWLLASESKDGSLDYDLAKIGFRLRMTALELEAAIVPLISGGFLELDRDAIRPLAEPERESSLEKETEEERESEEERAPPSAARVVVKRGTSNKQKGTRLGEDAEPDEQDIKYARDYGWSAERIALEWSDIRDWSKESRNGIKLDWHACWRKWVRRREGEQPTVATRTADRRSAIVAGVRGELSDAADIVHGVGGGAQPDGDGTGEPSGLHADVGGEDNPGQLASVHDRDGSVVCLGGIDGAGPGRAGGDGVISLDAGGRAGRPADDGDRADGDDAPIPQPAEARGYPEADRGGLSAAPVDVIDGQGEPESDPFDIPPFLLRSTGTHG